MKPGEILRLGSVRDVAHFQVGLKVGFRLDERAYGTYLSSHGDCDEASHDDRRCSSWLGNFESSAGLIISF